MQLKQSYNRYPFIPVEGMEDACETGWEQIRNELNKALQRNTNQPSTIVIETYQGILYEDILTAFKEMLSPGLVIDTAEILYNEDRIREITARDVTDDRIFGYLSRLKMADLVDPEKLKKARENIEDTHAALTLIFGYGASLVREQPSIFIYADMARWEIQLRMRANKVNNLGIINIEEHIEPKYKRGFFVDWRICDRIKKQTMHNWDYVLDSNDPENPKLATGDAVREGLKQAASQPFSVVPLFDPGPWGGQWMREKFELDKEPENFAWCFNCIPEENSMLLGFGETMFEIPSINLVFFQARELLGDAVHARFGDEFPIRFDFLDTMAGGNLSLQVHPLTEYIQENFGMHYTQDESYYMMDAESDGSVYLGLREGIDREQMIRELKIAEKTGNTFHPEKFVENFPAKKHDHFLIPAGTIHCSGRNGMVLEISATPYIFTFKLYDWGRVNLDGKPRPINLDHGIANIQWDRTTNWTSKNLVNQIVKLAEGDGWTEERTGLHEREFIETRRHWFSKKVEHNTHGGVNVLTLVEGNEVIVESPSNAFTPFTVHYAETFIVPAAVGKYTIRPAEQSPEKPCATVKAFVRTNA
jgi:mannose-6-phosphate isomerase class I